MRKLFLAGSAYKPIPRAEFSIMKLISDSILAGYSPGSAEVSFKVAVYGLSDGVWFLAGACVFWFLLRPHPGGPPSILFSVYGKALSDLSHV